MSSTTPPPIVPRDDATDDGPVDSPVDSADADRLAAQGEDPSTIEQNDGEDETNSADADYEASMGQNPETD